MNENLFRLYHSFRLILIASARRRADYLRTHKVFVSVGEGCTYTGRKIPYHSRLIKLHNNVHIATQVTFITHDIAHKVLNGMTKDKKFPYHEYIGCIEIGNNVFVGGGVFILPNTKIGNNVIIATGSVVNHDIPDNSVYGGVPAKYIKSFDSFVNKRQYENETYTSPFSNSDMNQISQVWNKFSDARKSVF